MNLILAALLAFGQAGAPRAAPVWTWTLYENEGPVVLANEAPDTPNLRATVECDPRSGVVDLTVYKEDAPAPGAAFARLSSGDVAATSPARFGRRGRLQVTVRTDHPLFAAFVGSGELTIQTGERTDRVAIPRAHLAKLRRLADRCAG